LTKRQVERLFGMDARTCDAALDALVTGGFLTRTHAGAYVLRAER
jgi:hypothetical protein